eukprot:5872394-Alexandrium_andersonii.AAC.1
MQHKISGWMQHLFIHTLIKPRPPMLGIAKRGAPGCPPSDWPEPPAQVTHKAAPYSRLTWARKSRMGGRGPRENAER